MSLYYDDCWSKEVIDQSKLPIYKYKASILTHLQHNNIIIITGATGCGKSTQVPQFIIDNSPANSTKVICTAPTRICTVSLAEYVNKLRGYGDDEIGGDVSDVGYTIGGVRKRGKGTRIEYQTAGVLNEILLSAKRIPASHICVDEVHTRTLEIDTILFLLKKIIKKNRWLKVILMSASINHNDFIEYFKEHNEDKIPVIDIPTRSYHVYKKYIGDLCQTIQESEYYSEYKDNEELHNGGLRGYFVYERPSIIYIIESLALEMIRLIHMTDQFDKTILVFLPGIADIINFERNLYDYITYDTFKIYILHSAINIVEQKRIFEDLPEKRKIILSTNIAESSITIPDVHYIFDFCLYKEMTHDPIYGTKKLRLRWACVDNLTQRAGRAGRVQDGVVYRLIPKNFMTMLNQSITPDMERVDLSQLILKLKRLKIGLPENILKKFITPPSAAIVSKAYGDLEEIKAISVGSHKVTRFGLFAVKLPLNIKSSYLVYLGLIFGFIHECIIVSAIMDCGSILQHSFTKPIQGMIKMFQHSHGEESDVFSSYFIYIKWLKMKYSNDLESKDNFCRNNMVKMRGLNEIKSRIGMIYERLDPHHNVKRLENPNKYRDDKKTLFFLKILMTASYRNNIVKTYSIKNRPFPFDLGYDEKRTIICDSAEHDIISRDELDDIKRFIESYDGGFGNVERIDFWNSSIAVEFIEQESEASPVSLMSKITHRDYSKIRKDPFYEFQYLPYEMVRGSRKIIFNPLFFPKQVCLSRFTVLREHSFSDDEEYDFLFGFDMIGGDYLCVEDCTRLPSSYSKGFIDLIFLIFGSKISFEENMHKIQVIQNNSLLYFTPYGVNDIGIVKSVNGIRKYVDEYLYKNKNEWKNTLDKQRKKYHDMIIDLFKKYHKYYNKNEKSISNSKYVKQLWFSQKERRIDRTFIQRIMKNISSYLDKESFGNEKRYSILLVFKLSYMFLHDGFFQQIKTIKLNGNKITFIYDKDDNYFRMIKNNMKFSKQIGYNKDYNIGKMYFLLKDKMRLLRKYFKYVWINDNNKNQIILCRE